MEIGPHLANILVGPIRNMRLSTDGVCIKLLTLRKDSKRWPFLRQPVKVDSAMIEGNPP